MNVLLLYIGRNLVEKPARAALVLFSIVLSTALFLASDCITDTLVKMYSDKMMRTVGTADILVTSPDSRKTPFFSFDSHKEPSADTEYVVKAIEMKGVIRSVSGKDVYRESIVIKLRGIDWADQQKLNPVFLYQGSEPGNGDENSLVVGKDLAERYGFRVGDILEIESAGQRIRFTLCAIAQPAGFFDPGEIPSGAIFPRSMSSELFGLKDGATSVYVKTSPGISRAAKIEEFSALYPELRVGETIREEDILERNRVVLMAFKLIRILLLFISIYIIFSTFKIIMCERLRVIGTFRSLGASKNKMLGILLLEGLLYGFVGGILGILLGMGLVFLMAYAVRPPWHQGMAVILVIGMDKISVSFGIALVLSVVSPVVPMAKASLMSVRNMLFEPAAQEKGTGYQRLAAGGLLMAVSIAALPFVPVNRALVLDTVLMAMGVASIILLTPYAMLLASFILKRVFPVLFGPDSIITAANLRSRIPSSNATLLAIGMAGLLFINTLGTAVFHETVHVFTDTAQYDLVFSAEKLNAGVLDQLANTEGVRDAYGIYSEKNVEVADAGVRIRLLQGIDSKKHLDFWQYDGMEEIRGQIGKLDHERSMIMTHYLKNRLGVEAGGEVTLQTPQGNLSYRVIGFFDTLIETGNVAMISSRYFKMDFDREYWKEIYLKSDISEENLAKRLKSRFADIIPVIMTRNEIHKMNEQANSQIFLLLNGFLLLTVFCCGIGMINNLAISFLERRRSLAVLGSIGMSKRQSLKLVLLEAAACGSAGSLLGITAGLLMLRIAPNLLIALGGPVHLRISPVLLLIVFLAGLVLMLVISGLLAGRVTRNDIVGNIRME